MTGIWKDDWKATSYWLDDLASTSPHGDNADQTACHLPNSTDVLIVGAGYAGLNAAIETARGGRSTLVLDAADPGWGCSTRNGGQISTSIKPSLESLSKKYGDTTARAIRNVGVDALDWIEQRIKTENIDCSFHRSGRFHAAHTPRHFEEQVREAETLGRTEGIETQIVQKQDQRTELGSDVYCGGVVFPRHASVNPASYHHGLLNSAKTSGAQIVGHCKVLDITKTKTGFEVQTVLGIVKAKDVFVATNGYTTNLVPWLKRRVIPIGSYIIATEPLPESLIDRLFPTHRVVSDTCKVVYYYRASPDRRRVIFGGRVSAQETNPKISGPRLYNDMCRIFPELRDYRISHSWMGTVAYSFDELSHTGVHQGLHYAMGFCGSGVSMASYLGMRTGQKLLGNSQGITALDNLSYPTRPFYTGRPWFLPPLVAWYRWRDRAENQRAAKEFA